MIDQLVFNTNPWQMRTWPDDPSLRLVASEITDFDDPDAPEDLRELRDLVIHMGTVMYAMDGAGLAAPQIGVKRRVVVVKDDDPKEQAPNQRPEKRVGCFAFCNPRILELSEETEEMEEGCLSLPGIRVIVERAVAVRVEHEDTFGEKLEVDAVGVEARVIQHEIDHLDGKLILDYLEPSERRLAATSMALERERTRMEEHAQQQEMYARLNEAVGQPDDGQSEAA